VVISYSKNQISPYLRLIESIGTSAKVVICSKIAPNLTRFRVQIACQYVNIPNISDMLIISQINQGLVNLTQIVAYIQLRRISNKLGI